jgi:hypothetical protein
MSYPDSMASEIPKDPRNLNVYLVTHNCARELVHISTLSKFLFQALPDAVTLPDVIAISLQEVAPLAYSFLGGSYIGPYFRQVTRAVKLAVKKRSRQRHGQREEQSVDGEDYEDEESRYVHLLSRHVGMTALMIFVREDLSDEINSVKTAGAGVGIWDMGNKGAVGARLLLSDGTELTFVSAHLAPFEWMYKRRNRDYEKIVRNLGFKSDALQLSSKPNTSPSTEDPEDETTELLQPLSPEVSLGLYDSPGYIFFAGDLNYRTSDHSPKFDDHKSYPQPGKPSTWFERDQLAREMKAGNVLQGFSEHPVEFPPTYKLFTGAGSFSEDGSEPLVWPWESRRWPSYCDRILYHPISENEPGVKVHGYVALPIMQTSDHRPVALSVAVERASKKVAVRKVPFPLDMEFANYRSVVRRREMLVGVLAYLAATTEGRAILAGVLAGAIAGFYLIWEMMT